MAHADQVPTSAAHDDIQVAPADGAESGAAGTQSEGVWVFGDVLPASSVPPGGATEMYLPGDSYLLLTNPVFSEAPGNLDHALDQLTTVTDLFDVPVIDFQGHS
jgi:hypothetical protein